VITNVSYSNQMEPSALAMPLSFRDIGERRPRGLEPVLSLLFLSASLFFLPFLPPKRPPKIPFFFFLVSALCGDGGGLDEGVEGRMSLPSFSTFVSTFVCARFEGAASGA
jgi:hypothetical protein